MNDRRKHWRTGRWLAWAVCALASAISGPVLAQQGEFNQFRLNGSAQPGPAVSQPAVGPTFQAAPDERSWKLATLAPVDFESRLFAIWGQRIIASEDARREVATFKLPAGPQRETIVQVNRRTAEVKVIAPAGTGQSWLRVLQAIDAPRLVKGRQATVVPVANADPATLQRTIALLKVASTGADSPHRKQHIGQFVSMIFQPEAGAQPPEVAPPDQPQPDQPADPGAPLDPAAVLGSIGNVTIEFVEGLDVVIIRGRQEDVEKVMRIIEEIERQSIQTQPVVEIYYLKHVDGAALNALIQQVYTTAFSSRLGAVTITPLVKPNALMIIGRKENVPGVIELIQKLDNPIPPQAQLRVFHLKHMSAIDAERTVRNFYLDRPGETRNPRAGLDVQVQTIAEYRANALIVQASPRGMEEIARLLEALDMENTGSNNEVKVFKLRNSLAEELAPALQEAITGQAVGGGQQVPQQQQPQAGGAGGQGETSPAIATRRATALQFLRIDANGEQLLQSGILADMRITADTRSNTLIVVGPAGSMELMAALIEQLDALPAATAELKVFTIVNGDASALAEMLQNLFGQQQQGGQGQQGTAGFQSATGAGESTLVPLRFSVDQRTNSIIASGNAGDLNVIYQILVRLDEGDIRQRVTTVYRLRNAPAADVAAALSGQTGLLTQQRELNQAAPELVSPYEQIEREVIVVAEPVTNSLIVSATPRYYEEIKRVIEELDRRPPMVMIQVLIAEVELSDVDQFGVEWGLQDSLMFDRSILTNRFNFNNAVFPNDNTPASLATREDLAGQALSNLALGRIDPTLGFGGLVLTASNESVQVLVRALELSSRVQVLSRPQVQTLDNQAARVQVGALVPRVQGITQTGFTATPVVVDTSVGIILQVQPRTSPDGTIVMQIYAEKSVVGPESTAIPIGTDANGNVIRSPQIPITTAQTTVSAKSGQTIILGGLITKDQTEITRRIPYLADMPVFGRLFRYDSVDQNRTELLIIMTPYIVQSQEQIDIINQMETERMSWCIADVVNIHGPVGLSGNPAFNGHETPLIFPDVDPAGTQLTPTPAATQQVPPATHQALPPAELSPAPLPRIPLLPAAPSGGPELPPADQSSAAPPAGLPPRSQEVGRIGNPSHAAPSDQPRGLVPQTIYPVVPPVGTQAGLHTLRPPAATGPVVPAAWQQTPGGVAPAGYQQPILR